MPGVTLALVIFAAAAPLDPATGHPLRVWLDGHRAALDLSRDRPELVFWARAHSDLPVQLEAIEVGILFARKQQDFETAGVAELYSGRSRQDGDRRVGVVRTWVEIDLAGGGEQPLRVEAALAAGDPEPAAWVAHVLGYRLADVNVALLRELVSTHVLADEAAVVETLALAGGAERKHAVRQRWGGRTDLTRNLVELAQAPLPDTVGIQVAIERVMAVRALGVLGGDVAEEALRALLAAPRQDRLSESLVVMGIARLRSPLEAPMAGALPPQAVRLADVVAAAQGDLPGWEVARSEASGVPVEPGAGPDAGATRTPAWALVAFAGVVMTAVAGGLLLLRRRRD
jgi:hypothetical protein